MTDPSLETADIPVVKTVPERKRSLSLVWIIPIIAALIGGWLVVKTIMEQGPTITIQFANAFGLEAGKTHIKYKDFDIGLVKNIVLSKDRQSFIVTAQLVPEAKPFLVKDTDFWIVRPRIAGGQVSGLGTLISGSYIGMNPGKSKVTLEKFVGLENPPAITADRKGKEFVLHATTLGSVDVGSPINYRGFAVGDVVSYQLDPGGKGVTMKIFVNTPYDVLVTENSRFWNSSGIDVTLDASGVQFKTQSLISILIGGLSFDSPAKSVNPSKVAAANSVFTLFPDRDRAMAERRSVEREMVFYFTESLRGLSVGAPVDFRGILVGKVRSINVEFDSATKAFHFPVTVDFDATQLRARLRKGSEAPPESFENYRKVMEVLVAKGLRGQLRSGNLLTGQLYVELDFYPRAAPAKIVWHEELAEIPTVQTDLGAFGERVSALLAKIEKMPLQEMIAQANKTLVSMDATLNKFGKLAERLDGELAPEAVAALQSAKRAADNMQPLLDAAKRTADNVEKLTAPDAPTQQEIREALQELTRAAESVRVLTDYLQTHPEALIQGKKEQSP